MQFKFDTGDDIIAAIIVITARDIAVIGIIAQDTAVITGIIARDIGVIAGIEASRGPRVLSRTWPPLPGLA